MYALAAFGWCNVQKWATAYSISAPKMKLKQMPRYTSMALMKQFALGREVRAPIISVVMVKTVATPVNKNRGHKSFAKDTQPIHIKIKKIFN